MSHPNRSLIRSAGVVMGMLLSTIAAVSATAATFPALPSFETLTAWLSTRDYVALGAAALVVAVVASTLAVWFVKRRRDTTAVAQGPDLRWWKNP